MNAEAVVRLLREALLLTMVLCAGPLGVALVLGFVVSLLQATTQMNDQSISFVPKLIAISVTLAMLGPWMLNEAIRFTRMLFEAIPLIQ